MVASWLAVIEDTTLRVPCFEHTIVEITLLSKRIFPREQHTGGLIPAYIGHSQIIKDGEQSFSAMPKQHRTVMRISFCHQHMAVESRHLRNSDYADAAE